jgi:hypothetical protein
VVNHAAKNSVIVSLSGLPGEVGVAGVLSIVGAAAAEPSVLVSLVHEAVAGVPGEIGVAVVFDVVGATAAEFLIFLASLHTAQ